MKIPSEFKMGGHAIRVKLAPNEIVNNIGYYNSRTLLILLDNDSDISESAQAEAFLHEIIEIIKSKHNLDLDHTHLTVISEVLFSVIRNNNLDFREEVNSE